MSMSSGSSRRVFICEDNPDMVCKKPLDNSYKRIQEAEIKAYCHYGEEYEMFCPMDLKESSVQNIYMRRADVIVDSLIDRCENGELDKDSCDILLEEWEGGYAFRDKEFLETFSDLAERTCEALYGEGEEFDREWLEEEFNKLLYEEDGKDAFWHLFTDFHSGNYGFITSPEGKHRIVCVDYAGIW